MMKNIILLACLMGTSLSAVSADYPLEEFKSDLSVLAPLAVKLKARCDYEKEASSCKEFESIIRLTRNHQQIYSSNIDVSESERKELITLLSKLINESNNSLKNAQEKSQ